jgi:hypothetical protein
MFPMFTIAAVNALLNADALDAKFRTVLSVLPPLKSCWSECRSPLLGEQVGVVGVVERGGRQVGVAAAVCPWAVGPERRQEGWVDVALVVDPAPEEEALSLPDRVSTCMPKIHQIIIFVHVRISLWLVLYVMCT